MHILLSCLLRVHFDAPQICAHRCSPFASHESLDQLVKLSLTGHSPHGFACVICLLGVSCKHADLQSKILHLTSLSSDPVVDSAIARLIFIHSLSAPVDTHTQKQSVWDMPVIAADRLMIGPNLTDNQSRARLLAVMASHSGDWLYILPVVDSHRLDNEEIHVVAGFKP